MSNPPQQFSLFQKAAAWFVHLYTASGIICALFALDAIYQNDMRTTYVWFMIMVFIDASDGPMARRFKVKQVVPSIDGALLDNIVDYATWSFLPIVLLWRSGWLPEPATPWCIIALICSLYAFTHTSAKKTNAAMFRGFPSYWNFFAIFADIVLKSFGPWVVALTMLVCSLLSVMPIYFIYPNRLKGWIWWVHAVTGNSWFALFVAMMFMYPNIPSWMLYCSLGYPIFYITHSLYRNFTTTLEQAE